MTSFEEFSDLSRRGNVIPVFETLRADTDTPVTIYQKFSEESPYSFLLESVEGGVHVAQYSLIGFDPFMKCQISERKLTVKTFHDDMAALLRVVPPDATPLESLNAIFAHLKTAPAPKLPRFTGVAVGYFGYECVRLVEEVPVVEKDSLNIPDAVLLFYNVVLVFDNVTRTLILVSNAYIPEQAGPEVIRAKYEDACGGIVRLKNLLKKNPQPQDSGKRSGSSRTFLSSEGEFTSMVDRARSYIVNGDVFQVVLSQRIEQTSTVDPFEVYRNLRMINPSPYMYFLRLDDFSVIGSSPEMLVRVIGDAVETRPIAGTRRRGVTHEEDLALEEELRRDPKEQAEHLMLVDLSRNDLGRICRFGSVAVTEMKRIEKYSHVMHLVSETRGTLRPEVTPLDALFSCFPAGTLSGAPKIRAMEIIAELEPLKRGIYGGAVAYIDFSGNVDSCIAIRTIVCRGNTYFLQAGAGVVYDSDATREYEETMEKLAANMQAVDGVQP